MEPPDSFYFQAALGWLELGRPQDAVAELDRLAAEYQQLSEVLKVRWAAAAALRDWDEALRLAEELLARSPDQAQHWLHRAYALRRARSGGLEQAWEALRPAADKFPNEPIIAYNLACYACQMGRLAEARQWLARALEVGDRTELIQMALRDSDLQPLWEEIRRL